MRIYTSSYDQPVRSTTGTGNLADWPFVWDGKDDAGAVVADGYYKYVIRATNGANLVATSTPERIVNIDITAPTSILTDPIPG